MATRRSPSKLLTAVELEMMRTLWRHGPGTVQDVLERLERKLAHTSVLTMLRILEQKGYARRLPNPDSGRAHLYAAAVGEHEVQKGHLRDLLARFFEGRPEDLVLGLIDNENVSRRDLERMRAVLEARLKTRGEKK